MFFSKPVCSYRLIWPFRALTDSSPEAYCTTDAVLQNDHRGPFTLYSNRCASLQLSTANYKLGLNCRTRNTCTNRPSKSSRISTCDLKELKYLQNEQIRKIFTGPLWGAQKSTERSGLRTPVESREVFRVCGNAESTGPPIPEMSFCASTKTAYCCGAGVQTVLVMGASERSVP
jgi:hypothetical protein